MLRNKITNRNNLSLAWIKLQTQTKWLTTSSHCKAKNISVNAQAKVIGKLFGNRVPGSKKRWYPSQDTNPQNAIFKASNFGKPTRSGGKNDTRRMTVLNKLFMEHITDLLATGEASESILGRGLQISRVKISPDFAIVNIYWLGSGQPAADAELEKELQSCRGILRHELSQLTLMGEVPRIKFVRDKTHANLEQVEVLLQNMVFDSNESEEERKHLESADVTRKEFFGTSIELLETGVNKESIPEMRHDVLGLNHSDIMTKILTKMRKSKEAWEHHKNPAGASTINNAEASSTILERINKKLEEAAKNADVFDKFLNKRRELKNTPERKRYRAGGWEVRNTIEGSNASSEAILSERQRLLYEKEDYIEEDECTPTK